MINISVICIRTCSNCEENIEIKHKDRVNRSNVFCSKKCEGEFKKSKNLNTSCEFCKKLFHLKKYRKEKYKHHFCSKECKSNYQKYSMKGEKNHQYGLKGKLNASWKSDIRTTTSGYRKIRSLNHPFKDCDGFMLEHRLVAEEFLLNASNSIEVDGKLYLNPNLVVHHVDENKLNNHIDNLMILTPEDHMSLHKSKQNYTSKEKDNMKNFEINNNTIYFAKEYEEVKIPSKKCEDAGYDIYAYFEEDYMIIQPHETKLIPTGLHSAFSDDYVFVLKERGSNGVKGIAQRSGIIDSGFRGEIKVPLTNTNNKPIIIFKDGYLPHYSLQDEGFIMYPYEKAICQGILLPVPKVEIEELTLDELKSIKSERGEGMLGSSGK